jgi:heme/copper-type cytochrome/quinol oxidase subunit 3
VLNRIITAYGFWIFQLSDFYATYVVLSHATSNGPAHGKLFDLRTVAIEAAFFLLSSFARGMATLANNARNMPWNQVGYLITEIFGLGFPRQEVSEFPRMFAEGAGPQRSAFLYGDAANESSAALIDHKPRSATIHI